ncbi:MAG: hypothetical protein KDC28_06105 [Saprospiraceae bacterium]|nr:hypothetical protein [Saprospiraceae bacterium]MCB9317744.1 hypothetical protein [Lewinellaceae bacterium]
MLRTTFTHFILLLFIFRSTAESPVTIVPLFPLTPVHVLPEYPDLLRGSLEHPHLITFTQKYEAHYPNAADLLLPPVYQEQDPLDDQANTMLSIYQEQTRPLRSLFNGLKTRLVNSLTTDDLLQLPVGIRNEIGGKGYTLGILKAEFTPQGAFLTIMVEIETADTSRRLYFAADRIPFSGSNGLSSGVRIGLIGDYPLKIGASQALIVLKGHDPLNSGDQGGTYVRVDCDGFKGLHAGADVLINSNHIIPVDASGQDLPGRLETHFEIDVASLDDIYVDISMDPFRISGVRDFYFTIQDVVLDFSDATSPDAKSMPGEYHSPFLLPGGMLDPLWRGIAIGELNIRMLPGLAGSGGNAKPEIKASQVLIDDQGFTGEVTVNRLLSLNEGNLDGWAFSIELLEVGVIANQFQKLGFSGMVHVPIFKNQSADSARIDKQDCFNYQALITADGDYQFSVRSLSEMSIPMWKARCHIAPNSALMIEKFASQFFAEATLHGDFSLSEDQPQDEMAGAVAFQNLVVRNVRPYISVGNIQCKLKSGFSIAGFSVVMDTLGIKSVAGDRVALMIGGGVSLTGDIQGDSQGIGASGGFTLFGKIREMSQRQVWVGDGFKVNDICIDIELKKFRLAGCLAFYDDDLTFGRGFYGVVDAELQLQSGSNPGFAVVAQFGSMPDYKYYLVDVLVKLGKGIPLGVLSLQGLGGGLSHHMSRNDPGIDQVNFEANSSQQVILGQSLSGIVYTPDISAGFVFRLNTILALSTTPKIVNGIVALSMEFNQGGGIRSLALNGTGGMITEVKDNQAAYQDAIVRAKINLLFDFENQSFTGILEVGMHTNSLQANGIVECNFSRDNWYIWIGTPQAPVQARLIGIGAEAYLDVGDRIPPPAALPANVARLARVQDFSQNASMLSSGRGLAFGFSIGNAGDTSRVGPLLVTLSAQLGADLLMREMVGVQCAGRDGPVGINNWYAIGQVFAFLGGSIVFDDVLFRKHVTFTIAQLAAAMLLQGRGPDPTFFQGILAGQYNLLNGLIKGSFRARLSIGDDCELVEQSSAEERLNLIVGVNPDPVLDTEIPTDINPSVDFMFPVGSTFVLPNADGTNNYFRFEVAKAALTSAQGPVDGIIPFATGKNQLQFQPNALLAPHTQYQFAVSLRVKERVNGTWRNVEENGQPVIIDTAIVFITGDGDSVLVLNNLTATYPVMGQQNFHPDEFELGYLRLQKWQPELLDDRKLEAVLEQNGHQFAIPITPDAGQLTLSFVLPSLETGQLTSLIIREQGGSTPLLAYNFRTSKYRTFYDKMAATRLTAHQKSNASFATDQYETDEPLDAADLENFWKLAVDIDIPWYQQFAGPVIYSQYPNATFNLTHEDEEVGFPPAEAVRLQQEEGSSSFVVTNGFYQMVEKDFYAFKTMVIDYLEEYLRGIDQSDVVDSKGSSPSDMVQLRKILPDDMQYILTLYSTAYKDPPNASLEYQINYTLPGGGIQGHRITSTYFTKRSGQ